MRGREIARTSGAFSSRKSDGTDTLQVSEARAPPCKNIAKLSTPSGSQNKSCQGVLANFLLTCSLGGRQTRRWRRRRRRRPNGPAAEKVEKCPFWVAIKRGNYNNSDDDDDDIGWLSGAEHRSRSKNPRKDSVGLRETSSAEKPLRVVPLLPMWVKEAETVSMQNICFFSFDSIFFAVDPAKSAGQRLTHSVTQSGRCFAARRWCPSDEGPTDKPGRLVHLHAQRLRARAMLTSLLT